MHWFEKLVYHYSQMHAYNLQKFSIAILHFYAVVQAHQCAVAVTNIAMYII